MIRNIILIVIISISILYLSIDLKSPEYKDNDTIQIEIKGAVNNPGIYQIDKGSTFNDVLEIITLNDNHDLSSISLNTTLYNNQLIVIPEKKDKELISINSASIEELSTLPGIGPSLAQRIVYYRENYGSFLCIEDIKNVSGIGDAKFNKIKQYITL